MSSGEHSWQKGVGRFVSGAVASCVAETATLPMDMLKVRMQVQGRKVTEGQPRYSGNINAITTIVRQEGGRSLWKGLSPALWRQGFYTSLCMLIYEPVRDSVTSLCGSSSPFLTKLLAGGTAGGISICLANPVDVVKVRMQSNTTKMTSSTLVALKDLITEEGLRGASRGVIPNVQRGIIVNAAELGSYDHAKEMIERLGFTGRDRNVLASCVAGIAGAVASNPVDVLKTRMMARKDAYKGTFDCLVSTVREDGAMALYKGFLPNWMRKGPWCIIFFMAYEEIRTVFGV